MSCFNKYVNTGKKRSQVSFVRCIKGICEENLTGQAAGCLFGCWWDCGGSWPAQEEGEHCTGTTITITAQQTLWSQGEVIVYYNAGEAFWPVLSADISDTHVWSLTKMKNNLVTNPHFNKGDMHWSPNKLFCWCMCVCAFPLEKRNAQACPRAREAPRVWTCVGQHWVSLLPPLSPSWEFRLNVALCTTCGKPLLKSTASLACLLRDGPRS